MRGLINGALLKAAEDAAFYAILLPIKASDTGRIERTAK